MNIDDLIAGLPGEHLIRTGLLDLQSGRWTIPAYLVTIARTRLSRAGLFPTHLPPPPPEPELALYQQLRKENGDAFSRYNALLRELTSFAAALDRRMSVGG